MNETEREGATSTCQREGVSLLEAARVMGVSEKTLRRKIHAGEVEGEKVALDGGGLAWRVYLSATDTQTATVPVIVPEGSETRAGHSIDRAGSATDTKVTVPVIETTVPEPNVTETVAQRTNATEVTETRAGSVPEPQMTVPEVVPDISRAEEMREEIKFLRGVIEAQNRDAAELRAALRTALAAMPKALPAAGEGGATVSENAANESDVQVLADGENRAPNSTTGANTVAASKGAAFERRRGFRSVLLRWLRG